MSSYTNLGSCIWEWEPFIALDPIARCLWLALYTTAEAKRIVPGLWHGSITAMSEAAKLPIDDTLKALDTLIDREMAEFDQKHRVLRLTMLPDGRESPPNGNVIRGWFKRFKTVPACQVRDAHVTTLAWIMTEWSRDSGKPISEGHQEAWRETFGMVAIPAARRRGVRRLLDSGTGTDVQPGLFDPPPVSPSLPASAAAENASAGGGTVPPPIGPTSDVRSHDLLAPSQDIETPIRETVREPFANGSDQDQDQDPDPDLDLLFLGRGGSGASVREISTPRPVLTLVPMPEPETPPAESLQRAESFLRELAAHNNHDPRVREGLQNSLCATIDALTAQGVTSADLALMSRWLAERGIGDIRGEPWSRLSVWVTTPGLFLRELAAAREHEHHANLARAELAEIRKQLGHT